MGKLNDVILIHTLKYINLNICYQISDADKEKPLPTYRDNDVKNHYLFHTKLYRKITDIIDRDIATLESFELTDYSLLTAVNEIDTNNSHMIQHWKTLWGKGHNINVYAFNFLL